MIVTELNVCLIHNHHKAQLISQVLVSNDLKIVPSRFALQRHDVRDDTLEPLRNYCDRVHACFGV